MQKGASFKTNLYAWAGRSVWPERRRLNWTMDFLDRRRLLNRVLWGIEGTIFLYLAANSAGSFDHHWEAQRCFMWWRMKGVKSVWGSWIRERQIKLDVDLARLIFSLSVWLHYIVFKFVSHVGDFNTILHLFSLVFYWTFIFCISTHLSSLNKRNHHKTTFFLNKKYSFRFKFGISILIS